MDLSNKHKDFFEIDKEPDSNVGLNETLPDFKAADSLAHVDLQKKFDLVKQISIAKPKTEDVKMVSNLLKPIGYLIALVAGFVFTIFFPNSGFEATSVGVVATIMGLVGITDWRTQFDNFEGFFKSKTTIGAVIAFIPVLISVVVIGFLHITLPGWATTLIDWVLTAGGGTTIIGVFHANLKASVDTTGAPPTGLSTLAGK